MTGSLILASFVSITAVAVGLLGLLFYDRERAAQERENWRKERAELIDRIMAVDYTKFAVHKQSLLAGAAEAAADNEPYDPYEDDAIAGTIQNIPQ